MVASGVSLRTAVAVGIVSYLLFSWVIPDLADRLPCSADGEESMLISLEDYSMLLPNEYQMAELPFQRRVHPCRVFSDTYEEARTAFLEAAQALKEPFAKRNPNPLSVQVHQLTVFTDDNDQKYTTDIVVLPGNQPGLVVHSSGVHGVEGYAGSAIQVAFLHLVRQFYEDGQLLRHPTVVLVHAVNPVGMARYRRVNERNVDLNRNGLQPDEWSGPYVASNPNRGNYDQFSASLFNPATPPTVWSATIGYIIQAAGAVLRYGLPQLKAAMVRGQYHDPTGIFYGGKDQPEPSLTLLKEWLENFLRNNNSNGTLATGAVTWVDVHTGLGPFAVDTLLTANNSIDGDRETTDAHVRQYFTAGAPSGSHTARTVALGYENIKGFINDYYQPVFAKQQNALIVTQEFGTWPTILVGRALILENAAHRHLPAAQALDWAKRTTKPAFYPQHSRQWRRAILERGVRVLVQAMRRSIQLSKHHNDGSTVR